MSVALRQPSLIVGVIAASASGAAIILYALGWVTLTYSVTILAPLSAFLFIAWLVRSGRGVESVFDDRLRGGLIAGALALIAYDLIRFAILLTGLTTFNPFRPIEVYGLLIMNVYTDTPTTKAVGWAFHLWNGFAFALMYTLAVGKGKIWWGLIWGLMLEISMIATYPTIFRLLLDWSFVLTSTIGHIAFGLTLGYTARKLVKS